MNHTARLTSAIFTAAILAAFLIEGLLRIPFPADVHYPESANVAPILLATRGEPLYQSIDAGTYAILVYPPVYYWLNLAVARAFDLGAIGIAAAGRSIALLFALLAAALFVLLRRQEVKRSQTPFLPLLAFALALSNPLLLRWSLIVRPDTGAIAFSILGLIFGWRGVMASTGRGAFAGLLGATIGFSFALGTKQTALAAPLSLFLFALLKGERKRALAFAALMLIAILGGLVFLRITAGPHALRNILATGAVPYSLDNYPRPLKYALRDAAPHILLLAAYAMAILWMKARWKEPLFSLTSVYLFVSFFGALVLTGKSGSTMNYYLEAAIIAGILCERPIAHLLKRHEKAWPSPSRRNAAIITLLLIAANFWMRPYVWHIHRDEFARFRAAAQLLNHLDGRYESGPVLSTDSRIALVGGNRPVMMDPFIFSAMRQAGSWTPETLHQMIANQEFSAFIFDFPLGEETGPVFQNVRLWPRDTVALMLANYHLAEQAGGFYIYEPNP